GRPPAGSKPAGAPPAPTTAPGRPGERGQQEFVPCRIGNRTECLVEFRRAPPIDHNIPARCRTSPSSRCPVCRTPPQPPPRSGEGEQKGNKRGCSTCSPRKEVAAVFLPLSASGRGLGGGVLETVSARGRAGH